MNSTQSDRRALPIAPGHVLYPVLALIALTGLLFGPATAEAADDEPEHRTHPYFPDHFWPYPVLAMVALATLGLLALVGQPLLHPGQPADPRAVAIPRPEWYFLALFQLVKLGPALITSMVIPLAFVLILLLWPVIDASLGPRLARRFGWHSWPAPKRNVVTGTLAAATLLVIGLLTMWALLWPELCLPWFYNGPVCGS